MCIYIHIFLNEIRALKNRFHSLNKFAHFFSNSLEFSLNYGRKFKKIAMF